MAKVIITCGKICAGKSTYARRLCTEHKAALLSVDEITLALFGQDAGEKHDEYVEKLEKYIFDKSVELVKTGISAVLDIGLWTRRERAEAREFYGSRGIVCEIHYLEVSKEEQLRRIKRRNSEMSLSSVDIAYYVDDDTTLRNIS